MQKITRNDLLPLEQYSARRASIRAEVMRHKKPRRVAIGPHATLYFEDYTTIRYQIQEMLRAEKIFEADAIAEEIAAYNPLIPDGRNWKATFMIEYEDVDERRSALAKLIDIELRVWVRVGEHEKVYAIADEDLERTTGEKTSAVHFLRFELSPAMITALKRGESLGIGIDHPAYTYSSAPVGNDVREALAADLDA